MVCVFPLLTTSRSRVSQVTLQNRVSPPHIRSRATSSPSSAALHWASSLFRNGACKFHLHYAAIARHQGSRVHAFIAMSPGSHSASVSHLARRSSHKHTGKSSTSTDLHDSARPEPGQDKTDRSARTNVHDSPGVAICRCVSHGSHPRPRVCLCSGDRTAHSCCCSRESHWTQTHPCRRTHEPSTRSSCRCTSRHSVHRLLRRYSVLSMVSLPPASYCGSTPLCTEFASIRSRCGSCSEP